MPIPQQFFKMNDQGLRQFLQQLQKRIQELEARIAQLESKK